MPIIVYTMLQITGSTMAPSTQYMMIAGAGLAGLYLPNMVVNHKAETNRTEILNGFPDALDLMLVCVEAGLGIDACFARVGQEVVNLHPRLARLFAGVSLELRAGRARADALKNMAKKSGVPEIQSFATLIVQSEKLGASIGQALKVYAGEMRESRRMRAEEKAHRLPVLLSVPLVIFLLPTMVGVLGLPAVIKIVGLDI
jgi:tight adherence protein C